MKNIIILTFALLLSSCATVGLGTSSTKKHQQSSAVLIVNTCMRPDGSFFQSGGSGVAVSPDHVVTAAHVIDCPTPVQVLMVTTVDGTDMMAIADVVSESSDTARLKLEPEQGKFKHYITSVAPPPVKGDLVCMETALPRRERKCGWVTKIHADDSADIAHSAYSYYGNSGSAVYNENGDYVGVVTQLQWCHGQELVPPRERAVCGGKFSSVWKNRDWVYKQKE